MLYYVLVSAVGLLPSRSHVMIYLQFNTNPFAFFFLARSVLFQFCSIILVFSQEENTARPVLQDAVNDLHTTTNHCSVWYTPNAFDVSLAGKTEN